RSASSIRLGRNPAKVLPPPVGAISSAWRPARAFSTMANWCALGAQPRVSNHAANPGGRVAKARPSSMLAAPGADDAATRVLEVGYVAGDDDEIMNARRRRNQLI